MAWYDADMDKVLEDMFREVDALPDEERQRILRVLDEQVREAKRRASPPRGRWARLAERLSRESPLEGTSEDFLRQAREFRQGFMLAEPKNAD